MSEADDIWNRAALAAGGSSPGEGDQALAQLLRLHNLAMSGGVLDALERMDEEEVTAAVAGYRYFGLESAASALEGVARELADTNREASPNALDQLEPVADARYATAVPDDSTIFRAFEDLLQQRPGEFAPASAND